jgi:DNA-binding response OmpR family regulator
MPGHTSTILIVDDEANLRLSLGTILQQAGYSVTAVGHAHDALASLAAGPFDLVFLDLKMPDMDGMSLLAEIRRLYCEMPVLILTAHATLQTSIDAVQRGAQGYFLKPLDPPLILDRVKSILDGQQQSQRRREIAAQIHNLLAELRQIDGEETAALPVDLMLTAPPAASTRFLQRGAFALDLHMRRATLNGKPLTLTPSSFDYLVTLVRHAPNPVPYETLVLQSQGYEMSRIEAQEATRWQIHQLRKAVETNPQKPRYICTERGVGYRLVA